MVKAKYGKGMLIGANRHARTSQNSQKKCHSQQDLKVLGTHGDILICNLSLTDTPNPELPLFAEKGRERERGRER